ncbi:MAG: 2-C-methyl-D-erythritol 4-phosphate cytidylyltransferase [Candidatus Latescibacteria bacterium]|nr:2-C-methyl-D-erythritol 4-phosphate cytidylyltransferase [Candidatus Latescibacterota bacterium]NIM22570.1 2-C-methyl-D-erythritol 4-phosphate cytidylyltransferase [Candidatus Latescibacterota bacterium]NIM64859.1 2-C-methyl-D-erythritol 4-phosphate cytidylyltransferase [Candidatus Latescibacterota bacterium]NIO01374.1 2-C-methyl-D-erythritol 4-phosphate cytidylyltransferase [Candidatus Latescibacterota bacterium]NIO27884.1 2-C-methyl-D-erythritol 4-phosphate cytidylyltransferase [Candidatus
MNRTAALIMAAGTGGRFGPGEPKQFRKLNGCPTLGWAVRIFSDIEKVESVSIVIAPGLEQAAAGLVEDHGLKKVRNIVPGGKTRQESVRLGLEELADTVEYVLVHDAARPCVSRDLIERVCKALESCNAVVPVMPAVDTLVREVDNAVDAILDRNRIAAVQTPQGFRAELLLRAHKRAVSQGLLSSDDGSLVLAMGELVGTIPGEARNIKITYPEDMKVAEAILSSSI